jgi:hypothetical protein
MVKLPQQYQNFQTDYASVWQAYQYLITTSGFPRTMAALSCAKADIDKSES